MAAGRPNLLLLLVIAWFLHGRPRAVSLRDNRPDVPFPLCKETFAYILRVLITAQAFRSYVLITYWTLPVIYLCWFIRLCTRRRFSGPRGEQVLQVRVGDWAAAEWLRPWKEGNASGQ